MSPQKNRFAVDQSFEDHHVTARGALMMMVTHNDPSMWQSCMEHMQNVLNDALNHIDAMADEYYAEHVKLINMKQQIKGEQ